MRDSLGVVKLDSYDYIVHPGTIKIRLDSSSDPTLVDIFSEISNSNGFIYVENKYYGYLDKYNIVEIDKIWWLDLSVMEWDINDRG